MSEENVPTEPSTQPAPLPPEPDGELVRKVFVKDLRAGEKVNTVFRVVSKKRISGRRGNPFWVLTFGDKTGHIDGRIFNDVDKHDSTFSANDYVLVTGSVVTHQGHRQVVADEIERLDPEPIDAKEFDLEPRAEQTHALKSFTQKISKKDVQTVVLNFLDKTNVSERLNNTHWFADGRTSRGPLLDHVKRSMSLAISMSDAYPQADRDLLIAGAFWRNAGDLRAFQPGPNGQLTDEGRLMGRRHLAAHLLTDTAQSIHNFSEGLKRELIHLVLADTQGEVKPSTLEASLLCSIDVTTHNAIGLDKKGGRRRKRAPRNRRDNEAPTSGGDGAPSNGEEAKRSPDVPPDLAFKPFSALTENES